MGMEKFILKKVMVYLLAISKMENLVDSYTLYGQMDLIIMAVFKMDKLMTKMLYIIIKIIHTKEA